MKQPIIQNKNVSKPKFIPMKEVLKPHVDKNKYPIHLFSMARACIQRKHFFC